VKTAVSYTPDIIPCALECSVVFDVVTNISGVNFGVRNEGPERGTMLIRFLVAKEWCVLSLRLGETAFGCGG
jgi:hypothetical protein